MVKIVSTFREIIDVLADVQDDVRSDIASRIAAGEKIGRLRGTAVMVGDQEVADINERKQALLTELLATDASKSASDAKRRTRAA